MGSLLQQASLYQAVNSFTAHSRHAPARGTTLANDPYLDRGSCSPTMPPNEFGV
jgi:hypothetical protein